MRELKIEYTKHFIRAYKKLNPKLQKEVDDCILDFKLITNHEKLKVHKLKGRFKEYYAFSINSSYRIIFKFIDNKLYAMLLTVGNHDIYNNFLN